MAAGSGGEKTEAPTPKKKKDARKKGQIPKSAELGTWAQMLVATVLLRHVLTTGWRVFGDLFERLPAAIAEPHTGVALALLGEAARGGAVTVAPLALGLVAVGIIGNLAQVGFVASAHAMKPKVERINPFKGLKRLFSPQSAWEAAKVVIKTSILAAVAWGPVAEITASFVGRGQLPIADTVAVVAATGLDLIRNTALAGLVLAAADYAFQRKRVGKQLKMTKQEVKDEHRQSEGDPSLKGQIRQRQLEISRNRMMAEVATASAVVVNPTHVAVAIRYDPATGAPRVVAKGQGLVAARIRAEAERHGVPLVRDVTLARTLHQVCDLGGEIPIELYEAVARLLAFVFALRRKGGITGGVLSAPPAPVSV